MQIQIAYKYLSFTSDLSFVFTLVCLWIETEKKRKNQLQQTLILIPMS